LGRNKIIGYSAHSRDEVVRAEADGADFATFGPVYYTPSKAAYGAPCGVGKLAAAVAAVKIPLFGLGGITPTTLPEVLSSGCTGIALISAILTAIDPGAATSSLLKKIEEHVTLS
jgi:thiamine-phosphate pyrophosphorylase